MIRPLLVTIAFATLAVHVGAESESYSNAVAHMQALDIAQARQALVSLADETDAEAGAPRPSQVARGSDYALRRKLEEIILPKLTLQQATMQEAVAYLRAESRRLDPDGDGVNIVLLPLSSPSKTSDQPRKLQPITIDLDTIPLAEAIRYVCSAFGLAYRIRGEVVVLWSADAVRIGPLELRTWPVDAGFLNVNVRGGFDVDDDGPERVEPRQFFQDLGVDFPGRADLLHYPHQALLISWNTSANNRMIHGILNEVGCCAGPNVLITCEVVSSPEPVPEDAWHDASLRRLATVSTCTGSGETAVTTTPQGHALTVMPTVAADGLHVDLEWELALHTPAGPQQFEGHFFLADRATILLPIANPGAEHRYLLLSVRFLHWSGKPYRPLDWR